MLQVRIEAIREELATVQTLPELKAIWCHWQAECPDAANDAECIEMINKVARWIKSAAKLEQPVVEEEVKIPVKVEPIVRAPRAAAKYQLLNTEVSWTAKPQVLAVMHILSAHAKQGDVLSEADIVEMMIKNEAILNTRQGGKRVWDYYKGNHHDGLIAHGNLKKV